MGPPLSAGPPNPRPGSAPLRPDVPRLESLPRLVHHAPGGAVAVARRGLARIATFRVIAAADEAAELAELEREPAGFAARAFARIGAVRARRKEMRRQHLIERVDHLGDP